ncbi:ABC transporter permease [Blautia schinkii]|nr:ABC transporter permease [Blautia schinkii]
MEKNKKFQVKNLLQIKEISVILPLLVLIIVAMLVNPSFLRMSNILDVLRTSSFNAMIAVPLTFLMASGRMDLSIAATTTLGGLVAALAETNGVPLVFSILLALVVGALVGFANSILVEKFDMPGFIATMATSYVVKGIASVLTNNNPVSGISDAFQTIAKTRIGGSIWITIVYALIIGVIGQLILSRTKYGRSTLAVGGNPETANLAGIDVKRRHSELFILVGIFAAVAGCLHCSRFASAQLTAGSGTELTILASCIIGGTSLRGGTGTVTGSILGCILFATITNALLVMGVPTTWQNVVYGAILIVALFIDIFKRSKLAKA